MEEEGEEANNRARLRMYRVEMQKETIIDSDYNSNNNNIITIRIRINK